MTGLPRTLTSARKDGRGGWRATGLPRGFANRSQGQGERLVLKRINTVRHHFFVIPRSRHCERPKVARQPRRNNAGDRSILPVWIAAPSATARKDGVRV